MKSYTKTKVGSKIAIRKIADLIREKEKRRTFVRTDERANAHYVNKPENRSIKKTETKKRRKTKRFFEKTGGAEIEARQTSSGVRRRRCGAGAGAA